MNKKIVVAALILASVSLVLSAKPRPSTKSNWLITPQFGFGAGGIRYGGCYEKPLTENLSIGGSLMIQSWRQNLIIWTYSATLITPALEAAYHLTSLDIADMDLFGGIATGVSFAFGKVTDHFFGGSASASKLAFYLSPFIGGRYFLNDRVGLNLRVAFSVLGNFRGVSALIGMTLRSAR